MPKIQLTTSGLRFDLESRCEELKAGLNERLAPSNLVATVELIPLAHLYPDQITITVRPRTSDDDELR